jgi:ABC-2 type transport system ATP-binding protein
VGVIRAQNVSKYYGGKRALGPVSFEIEDGETVGFLGLNGAGKTTALRVLACDLRPSSGTVAVGDIDVVANPHEVRRRIGFLPENPPLYPDMTVVDYLGFAGRLRGMSKAEVRGRMGTTLELTDLTDVKREYIGHLSHGYRQRVGVAQAIIHAPTLLILDEPTRGLDPVQIVEMRKLINDLKEAHTVLISSHILTEISQTCDRLLVLDGGRILAAGSEDDLSAELREANRITVTVRVPAGPDASEQLAATIREVEGVDKVVLRDAQPDLVYDIDGASDVRAAVARAITGAGHDLLKLDYATTELEGVFLGLIRGGDHARN